MPLDFPARLAAAGLTLVAPGRWEVRHRTARLTVTADGLGWAFAVTVDGAAVPEWETRSAAVGAEAVGHLTAAKAWLYLTSDPT